MKVLNGLGDMLPKQQYKFKGTQKVTGEDAILAGHKEINGSAIDSEEEYTMNMPFSNTANHGNRLKSAFRRNGIAGVCKYLKPYYKPEGFGKVQVEIFKQLSI
jgi:hypothetical protein